MSVAHPYATERYATALASGTASVSVAEVACLDTWVLLAPTPTRGLQDARGPYPFSPLGRPTSGEDFRRSLRALDVVSLVVVTDVFQETSWLPDAFDFVVPYKLHYVIDLAAGPTRFTKHHRYEIRRARRVCETRQIDLADHLGEWIDLYRNLADRRALQERHRFASDYFEALAGMEPFVVFGAFVAGRLVSCQIWMSHDGVAVSHLAASSEEGYRHLAAYALYDEAIAFFADSRYVDLGGVPDADTSSSGGLARFKKGFSNQTRWNRICGAVVDGDAYLELCRDAVVDPDSGSYFPAYRGREAGG